MRMHTLRSSANDDHDDMAHAWAQLSAQDRQLARMRSRNRLEVLDALELALEGAVVVTEFAPPDDLHGAQFARATLRRSCRARWA